jgi:hypothetical protein
MIESLVDRKKDYVFSAYMPPPTPVKTQLVRVLKALLSCPDAKFPAVDKDAPPRDFEYNLNATSSSVKSIQEQIARD